MRRGVVTNMLQLLCQFPFITKEHPTSLARAELVLSDTTRGDLEHIMAREIPDHYTHGSPPVLRRQGIL